ncbi:MAG: cysteine synthase A [Proteobacteria bacterium]|nr:cysteine synthase A [Pseudomonadota bacterium]
MQHMDLLHNIGSTPIVDVSFMENKGAIIVAKAEFLNPGGSIKDRVATFIIEKAEEEGRLKKGMSIVEATSGNAGIATAMVGAIKGYGVKIIMPENMSEERKKMIRALGAELILTPAEKNISGSIDKLDEIRMRNGNIFILDQFRNSDNAKAHYMTTGPEIWEALGGHVDIFVAGVGTGGTLMGAGKYLKERNPAVMLIAVEPQNVSALLGHEPGLHKIEGIGDGFLPDIVEPELIDGVVEVRDEDAIRTARRLGKEKGILVGISSGANVWAATEIVERFGRDKLIVTVLPDRAERYFSTELFIERPFLKPPVFKKK